MTKEVKEQHVVRIVTPSIMLKESSLETRADETSKNWHGESFFRITAASFWRDSERYPIPILSNHATKGSSTTPILSDQTTRGTLLIRSEHTTRRRPPPPIPSTDNRKRARLSKTSDHATRGSLPPPPSSYRTKPVQRKARSIRKLL